VQSTEEIGGNVLVVGHSASVDTCTRQLVGKDPRPVNELMAIVRKVDICIPYIYIYGILVYIALIAVSFYVTIGMLLSYVGLLCRCLILRYF
jgi:hypothetical protein